MATFAKATSKGVPVLPEIITERFTQMTGSHPKPGIERKLLLGSVVQNSFIIDPKPYPLNIATLSIHHALARWTVFQ